MKNVLRLMCGWMAIALAACTGDELQQIEPLQKPVAQKTISVKAYTPSEQAATRLAFEDKDAEGLKLSWSENDAFTALIDGEEVMFEYDEDSKEFTANVAQDVTLTDGIVAYYPAYDGENFEMDFSQQTGQLNSATTYMVGEYEGDAFKFTHSTAILKASFGLPPNAVISSIQISGAVDITISNATISKDSVYINLPAIAKDTELTFTVATTTNQVFTATKTTAEEGIKTGVYYNTIVDLQEACLLPTGGAFKSAIRAVGGYENATSIVFEANVADEAPATLSDPNYTIALAGNVLTISTPLSEFVFNKNCNGMFSDLINIQSIDFGNCVNTANVIDMGNMFNNSSALSSLNLSSFNTERVINMSFMFQDCSSLTSLDLSNFNTANVMFMNYMFNNCSSLNSLDLSSFNTANVMNMVNMFDNCSSLQSITFGNSFNTANVTDMDYMFQDCSALTSLDLSSFNTSKVTDMNFMFNNCSSLQSITFGNSFNTANVTNMGSMFSDCSALTSLDLSNFNTSKVTDMNFMFFQCSALTLLDVSSFNTAKVTDMDSMFYGCSLLTSLDLSSFDTSKVTTMDGMFYDCFSISELRLINFDFRNVTDFDDMFYCLAKNNTETVKVYVYVTQDSYNILKDENTGINSAYAWFVNEGGIKYED